MTKREKEARRMRAVEEQALLEGRGSLTLRYNIVEDANGELVADGLKPGNPNYPEVYEVECTCGHQMLIGIDTCKATCPQCLTYHHYARDTLKSEGKKR